MTETEGLIAGLFLFFALIVYIFRRKQGLAALRERPRIDLLLERKAQLTENLRELNFEFQAGKYPEEDFTAQREILQRETAELLVEIERQGLGTRD
jgi:hypothetical protein